MRSFPSLAVATVALCGACFNGEQPEDEPPRGPPDGGAGTPDALVDGPFEGGDATSDAKVGGDVSPCGDGGVARRFGDGLLGGDFCWAPPRHYCAQGGGASLTVGCASDGSGCCRYGSTCQPCGFVDCTYCRDPNTPAGRDCPPACSAPIVDDPALCQNGAMKSVVCFESADGS